MTGGESLHDDERRAAVLTAVVDGDDFRMVQGRRRTGLVLEPTTTLGIRGQPGMKQLDGDRAAEPGVPTIRTSAIPPRPTTSSSA
jgi:hypothetical protein